MPDRLLLAMCVALPLLLSCSDAPRFLVGEDVRPVSADGRWQLVNYWAVWCKPCRKEIPVFNQLAKASPELLVLGVNFDQPVLSRLRADRDALAIDFPVLAKGRLDLPRPHALPTTYVIDPDGRQVAVLRGEQSLESLIQALSQVGLQIPAY